MAAPIRPPVPGVELPGVFAVRSIPDSRRIRSWIVDHNAKTAVVVGGGFIGLEAPELVEWGGQVRAVPFKKVARSLITYLEKPEMDALLRQMFCELLCQVGAAAHPRREEVVREGDTHRV